MSKRIDKIVVVGGGTAGWMSACYLNKALGRATGRDISVTVVESDDVGIIGVGEATIPSIRRMLQILEIPEWRLFRDVEATFKNAIKFIDWLDIPKDGKPSHYYHQFDPPIAADGYDAMTHWLALKQAGRDLPPLADSVSIAAALCDNLKGPKWFNSEPYEAPVLYAYHIDTTKLGRMLREISMERGVGRIVDHVTSIDRAEDGDITAINTRDGRHIEGDLFIDCTGFAAVLIEKHMGEGFVDFSNFMPCDRAVAGQVQYTEGHTPRPFTVAHAKSAGWIWEIDLAHRRGSGYVYSSRFIDDDAAEKEFLEHADPAVRDQIQPRRIKMRIGRRPNAWVNNCVAIGLSAGFIEPLESTGIHLAELGIIHLVDYIAEGAAVEPLRKQFNDIMRDVYDEIANFILMHYMFNRRHGQPFWDYVRNIPNLPDSLLEQLEIWKHRMPTRTDLRARINVFEFHSYVAVMGGVEALPKHNNISPFLDLKVSAQLMAQIAQMRVNAVNALPSHLEIIQRMRAMGG